MDSLVLLVPSSYLTVEKTTLKANEKRVVAHSINRIFFLYICKNHILAHFKARLILN